jgi:putative ABC transport system permease protein
VFRLALRNIFRHKTRTAMTLAAIAFGVAALILSGGFIQDTYVQLGESIIHSQSGHIQIAKTGYFSYGSRSPEKYILTDPDAEKARVATMPEVADAMARLSFAGLINNGRADLPIVGEGVEPAAEARLGTSLRISEGRALEASDQYGMLVGKGVASSLQLRPGDRPNIVLSTPDGAMNTLDFEVVGIFQSFSREYDARAVRIPLAAAQELLGTKGANAIVVSLHRTRDTADVTAKLSAAARPAGLEVLPWNVLNDFYENTVALYERQFGALQLIILAMVLLSVINSVNMTVSERTGEFGTLRALGSRGRQVIGIVVLENLGLGIVGSMAGVFVGIMLALIISAIGIPMPPPPNSDVGYIARIRVVPAIVGIAFLVGLIATVVAALFPAWRASRVPVVDALRQNV